MNFLHEHKIELEKQLDDLQGKLKNLNDILNLRDVAETDSNGNTQLHLLLKNVEVNETVVKQLLDAGANVNARNNQGQTPLYCALASLQNCEISIIELLVNRGASVENLDVNEYSPLSYALCFKACPVDVIKFLIENGANVHGRNANGYGVFDIVLQLNNKPLEIVKLLIEKGADIYAVNHFGESPLHVAAKKNRKDVIKFLLTKPKTKINLPDENRNTPLHLAVAQRNIDPEIVDMLLKAGANVLKKNKFDQQALHMAAFQCNPVVIQLLLDNGAKVNVLDKKHHSPLDIAVNYCKSFNRAATKMLLDAGALIFENDVIKIRDRKLFPPSNSWPFPGAANIYMAEISGTDKLEQRMQQVQLLLKYALLENPRLDFQTLPDEVRGHALIDFGEQCLRELKTVCSGPNITLAQYILRARLREEEGSIVPDILEILSANAFPLYKEVVLGLVSREELKEAFQQHSLCTVSKYNSADCVVLDYDTLCWVMMYLENEDLLNLLLAVYDPKKVVPSVGSSSSDQDILDEIEAEYGRFFKRARIV